MAYKLMAVDIDGTLLDNNDVLTKYTIDTVRRGVEKGLIFTLSTGRPVQGVQEIIRALGLNFPVITYNGAKVVMGESREILYEKKLSFNDVKTIVELGQKFGTSIMVWDEDRLFANPLNEKAEKYSTISGVEPEAFENAEIFKNGATKILWYDEVELINKYKDIVGSFISGDVNYHTSRPYFLEFVDKRASKAIAMEKLGEHFGISREEMIAVGDGYNDLSMIKYAGLGVAMGNAPDDIKESADFVTLSNDEDGVAHVISKFILGE
ncbi:MAG TPA: HAD family phosphatase [Clostridiaceae bacterium]|jgi:Cof subfamily protein (haloacid dehalogenase superfamily)|nr:HAD family phosphatase [Clostridiaceae bacterium]